MSDWDAVVFGEGYKAWMNGDEPADCPYEIGGFLEEVWCEGWARAEWEHRG